MNTPDLSGALQGLRALDVSDLAPYKAAVAAGQQVGWGYYFPYLLARDKPGRSAVLVGTDNGSLCVFEWKTGEDGPRLDLLFPPTPLDMPALERALERANDFNGDHTAKVMRIDEKDAGIMASASSLRLRERRSQYLFAPATYDELGGRQLRTLRRQVAAFEGLADVEIVPYAPAHEPACLELLRHWRREHRAAHGTAGGAGTTARAIELTRLFGDPDLRGELVFVGGRLAAFAFGGEIRPGVACFFEAKSDASVPGLAYAHRRSFLLSLRDFDVVNDGSDTGRPGLRQLKDSFRPVAMHAEYRATQRRAGSARR